jgi:hypothetical protein
MYRLVLELLTTFKAGLLPPTGILRRYPKRPKLPLQALSTVLPGLTETLIKVNRPLAVRLAKEPAAVALKLVSLRALFPDANLLAMIEKRCEDEICVELSP